MCLYVCLCVSILCTLFVVRVPIACVSVSVVNFLKLGLYGFFVLSFCLVLFWGDRVSLCSLGYAGLKLSEIHLSLPAEYCD